MIVAAFLAILALTLLAGARLGVWLYSNSRRESDNLRADEWWNR